MHDLANALETAVTERNWYGALFMALALPDICGHLENPGEKSSQKRYEQWFDIYVAPKYRHRVGAGQTLHEFLSSSDCYALRCAMLHEGSDKIMGQRARQALERFHFTEPPPSGSVHCNQVNNILQLQVDIFCQDTLSGLRDWLNYAKADPAIMTRVSGMLKIHKKAQF